MTPWKDPKCFDFFLFLGFTFLMLEAFKCNRFFGGHKENVNSFILFFHTCLVQLIRSSDKVTGIFQKLQKLEN